MTRTGTLPEAGQPNPWRIDLRKGWLIPAWAALCGAASAGRLIAPGDLASLSLAVLAVAAWMAFGTAVNAVNWPGAVQRWRALPEANNVPGLPFSESGSPSARIASFAASVLAWARDDLGAAHPFALLLAPVSLVVLALIVPTGGALVGASALLALAAGQLSALAGVARRSGWLVHALAMTAALALPMLLVHATLAATGWATVGVAAAGALGIAGQRAGDSGRTGLHAGWILIGIVLLAQMQLLAGMCIAALWLPVLSRGRDAGAAWMLLAILTAAAVST